MSKQDKFREGLWIKDTHFIYTYKCIFSGNYHLVSDLLFVRATFIENKRV